MNEEYLKSTLDRIERRLNAHSKEIDHLKEESVSLKVEIKNLCDNLKSLTSMLKWFITAMVGAFISFFFYAVQSNLFK
jgi:hypothetical protein